MEYTALSKELLKYWAGRNIKSSVRQKYLLAINLSINSAKTDRELSFMADCAYIWAEGAKCLTMKWEEFDKLDHNFSYISARDFKNWLNGKPINNEYENRLQKQKADVVRGDDAEGNRVQGRVRKITITVGYLSNKTIKG